MSQQEHLRRRLLQYPGVDESNVDDLLLAHEQRNSVKKDLTEGRGFSNAAAEAWLDRAGHPRPPGWSSVFFYPDSLRPRNKIIFFGVILSGLLMVFLL